MSPISFFYILIFYSKFTLTQELDPEPDKFDYGWQSNNSSVGNFTDSRNDSDITTTESEFERVFQEAVEVDLPGSNCTPSFIDEFPPDLFTAKQRRQGYIVIHCLICFYVFYAFAIVCGDYFVPSVERLSKDLKMESDIAGATIMGIATSSPELFTSIVGTFIMRGDIGVGTVVGSAVFNHLAVCAFIGFGCSKVVVLDWWPVTRDVFFYAISVIALFVILLDERIYLYESATLLALYGLYILGMYHDAKLHALTESLIRWEPSFSVSGRRRKYHIKQRRKSRILGNTSNNSASSTTIVTISKGLAFTIGDEKDYLKPMETPKTSKALIWFTWIFSWPIRAVTTLTIPDCRRESMSRFYALTFIMSSIWIALLSYVATWMVTIVAHTFRVPDTVFGVSIIAAGTSVPEAVSSVIVAKKGLGTMAVSGAVGSNTFNILVCLGVPWLIKGLLNMNLRNNYAEISSLALEYNTGMLIVSLLVMYGMLVKNEYKIDKKMAVLAFVLYICFLAFDTIVEMNILFFVNLPIC
ncbi:Sodium/potassium/calcium exchanger 5 [Orchesella cincta]|uniref:Sodium/potassium/calcium exchanger 5 n=1 Tax=Orchesella cincta TaxID=48709 RepID=A0A1D2MZI8_ORCCI|nr:Sodium/potassium/calcium exchanger 5 [Orchesella cincta]